MATSASEEGSGGGFGEGRRRRRDPVAARSAPARSGVGGGRGPSQGMAYMMECLRYASFDSLNRNTIKGECIGVSNAEHIYAYHTCAYDGLGKMKRSCPCEKVKVSSTNMHQKEEKKEDLFDSVESEGRRICSQVVGNSAQSQHDERRCRSISHATQTSQSHEQHIFRICIV